MQTAIFHDSMEGNVYVSLDEGKTWNLADGVPTGEAAMFIEHPVDNRYVSCFMNFVLSFFFRLPSQGFVLTGGKTHYRTEDRGRTWRPFQVPLEPALVSHPLSFHSDPAKYGYILYQGIDCVKQGWGHSCHDEVCRTFSFETAIDTPLYFRLSTQKRHLQTK